MLFSDNQAESSLEEVMAVLAGRGRWPGRLSPAAKLSLPRSIRSQQRQADPALPALPSLPALLSPATIILACVRHTDLGSMQSLREKNFTFLKFSFGLSVQNFLVNKSYE